MGLGVDSLVIGNFMSVKTYMGTHDIGGNSERAFTTEKYMVDSYSLVTYVFDTWAERLELCEK